MKKRLKLPLVSIITPTMRKGWWNIMANNIAMQTYKNVEWLIIDDFPTNREYIAKEYAKAAFYYLPPYIKKLFPDIDIGEVING